jgi:uncharacterized membrane protein (UPF0127 family)
MAMPHSPATLLFNPGKLAGFAASLAGMIIVLCGISGLVSAETRTQENLIAITMPGGVLIHAELAATPQERSRGLMFRENLAKDHGMLFAFAEAQPWTFWMKNTKIPLDIIWMDGKKKIVHIESNVPICTRTDETCPQYRPTGNAMFVLELAGGVAETLKLQNGAKLQFLQP